MTREITMAALDIDAVEAFVLTADLRSFTRAAEVLGTTQSVVSLKLRRLEERLGRRLLERTPRLVRLSPEGAAFLQPARDLLAAHERALACEAPQERRLVLGISDHVAGPDLPRLLARLGASDPALRIEIRSGFSRPLLQAFDAGELDAAIVRREADRRDGEALFTDDFGWFAAESLASNAPVEPLPLASLAPPCGVRGHALRLLDAAGIAWTEAFVGSGIAAVTAAVEAGLAVAPLARRIAPPGAVDVGPDWGLPAFPSSPVVLHSRASDPRTRTALRTLTAAFRARR